MNCDDHVKNIAYIMNRRGEWKLSPAFDVTYAYSAKSNWVSQHQMALNNRRANFELDDLLSGAANASISKRRAKEIIDEVQTSVRRWMEFSEEAGVYAVRAEKLKKTFVYF